VSVFRPSPVRWLREHPTAADGLLAALVTSLSLVFHLFTEPEEWGALEAADPSWWGALLTIAATAPVAFRRVAPKTVVGVVTAAQVTAEALGVQGPGFIGVLIAVYSLAAHDAGQARRWTAISVTTVIGVLFLTGWLLDEVGIASLVSSVVILVSAYAIGDNVQRRRQAAIDLVERAERAERERDLVAHQRVADERTRIARDLHDVVAHSVSVMVIQAAAARRTLETDPATASATLEELETTGRQAMNDLRRVLGVLRGDGGRPGEATRSPQPGLADLRALLDANEDLPLTVDISADPDHPIPGGVPVAVYRIVQEALTNVRRHAGPVRSVTVALRCVDDALEVTVEDDGRGAAADRPESAGYGLVGMRERAVAAGGRLHAGPRPGGGWRVRATFPVVAR
jgi:signal transduction histidine kinase